MKVNDIIRLVAGLFVIISVALGYYVNELWFLFTLFVGLNLFQSSLTKWCLLESMLKKAGLE